jgi:hypothetical protein
MRIVVWWWVVDGRIIKYDDGSGCAATHVARVDAASERVALG